MATSTTDFPSKPGLGDEERIKMQIHLIEAMRPVFENYLEPIKILARLSGINQETRDIILDTDERGFRREAVRRLIDAVLQQKIVSEFIQVLRITGFQRFLDVLDDRKVSDKTNMAAEYCEFLVGLLQGDIIDYITDPTILLPNLFESEILDEDAVQDIRVMYENRGFSRGCQQLFKCMPRMRSDWPFDFFRAMKEHFPGALRQIEVDADMKANVYGPANRPTDQDDTSRPGGDDDGDDEADGNEDGFSDDEEKIDGSVEKDVLPMREYQYELSQVAINGENTIICAPTGSGKTRVALYIVRDHLSKTLEQGKKKIVFLARTTPLVNQQAKTFQKYLPAAYSSRVCHVTGESDLSMQLHTVFDFYDIFVLTPQILDNHLKYEKIKSLSEFSLLILDECHHTRKGEPYNNLMKKYLKAKKAGENGLPQIIGLTASLGVEKATTIGEATISILKLCANLDVRKLSTVTVNKAELEKTVPKPDERRVALAGSRCDEARSQIHIAMLKIEHHLDEAVLSLGDREISALKRKRPSNLNNQSYGQWAVEIRRSAMKIHGQTEEAKALTRTIVVTARQLEVYNSSMDIHDLVRLSDVLDYLEKVLRDNLEKNKHSPVEADLSTYFRELKMNLRKYAIEDENPNLRILKKEIINLRKEKGSDSLGIIFVRTRGTCYAICEWMKSDKELRELNTEPFTGAGAHEDEGGMTQNQQDAAISRFRAGEIKFLVATSVAEEGLDIPDCNIVIRYNHVGNEITTVQTRGRSRKRGGTSVLLGMDEVLKREILNIGRSKMMEEAILQFKQMPWKRVIEQIENHQEEVIQEEQLKEELSKLKQRRKINNSFQLLCFKCKKLSIDNEFIKTINNSHHVVIDPDFMLKVDLRPDQSPLKPFDGIQITGKIHCKECHNHLGVMFRYRGIMFPAIRVESFQISSGGQMMLFRKWKDLPFAVKDIGQEDYKRMISREFDAQNPEQFDNDVISNLIDLKLGEENSDDGDSDFVFVKERYRDNKDEKDTDETEVKY